MILDTLDHHSLYTNLGPGIAQGLAWIAKFSPQMPDGRYDLADSTVFALVQSYETVAPGEKKYESHRDYLDIQYLAAGSENIHYAPVSSLQPVMEYQADKDYLLYADPKVGTPLALTTGTFAIFYPQDGHKPGCVNGAVSRIKKVVIKVRV